MPGHSGTSAQESDSVLEPMQSLPPLAGAGSVHVLDLVHTPPSPQVTEHPDQEPHEAQLPSVEPGTSKLNRNKGVYINIYVTALSKSKHVGA